MNIKNVIDKRTLAQYLDVEYSLLTDILYNKKVENLYFSFCIPKKHGGQRTICAPNKELKKIQKTLASKLSEVQESYYVKSNSIVHGFTKKRSIITNGKSHRNKRYVLCVDLEDFFDSFHFGRVKGYFQKNKHFLLPEDVASCLANIVCYKGKLPQGAPSSPVITNLICAIMDRRIAEVSKKYHMTYTRYADDLTFSTNDRNFENFVDDFLTEVSSVITHSGFKVNDSKTRISFCNSRQEVTGLVVNKKINVKRDFYKDTRAMLDYLYKGKMCTIDGCELTIRQVEGRLAFINQLDKENNKGKRIKSARYELNSRERQYQEFLFYKYFLNSDFPLIVTEGKTDHLYIEAALKAKCTKYPKLVKSNQNGSFDFSIRFLNRTNRLGYFLGIFPDGADAIKNIYNFYVGKNNNPNLFDKICAKGVTPKNPVILLFDNETISDKPLKEFKKYVGTHGDTWKKLQKNNFAKLGHNLYVATIPLVKGYKECEIEDLFTTDVLNVEIDGKKFNRKGSVEENCFGKQVFASHISMNWKNIDFENFVPLLDAIDEVVKEFECENRNKRVN